MYQDDHPSPRNVPLASRLCAHFGLTARGFWAYTAAVGVVFVSAALSYFLLFPAPSPGLPFVIAVIAGSVGAPALVIGLSEVCAERGRPFRTDQMH